ncbi:MAG TPA: hypothetical protein P5550_06370 [Bacteroidales bacterium]|nr:hypothetical protein [Bacteroidales bacterium]HRZ77834.1 hypothetical protein [Bacteroidales bacterium]
MLKLLFWLLIIYFIYRLLNGWIVPTATRSYIRKQEARYKPSSPAGSRVILEEGERELIIPPRPRRDKNPADHLGEEAEYEN